MDEARQTAGAAPRRRTQGERSRETREKLLQATLAVLLDRGYAGLTTALVDAQAGVSSGARVHHFPSKGDLVIAATIHAYEQAGERGRRRAEMAKTDPDPLRCFVQDCRSIYFDWPFLVAIEVIVTARTDPALMERIHPVMEHFRITMNAVWTATLEAAGFPRAAAARELDLTLNLIRGMAVNSLWRHDRDHYDRLLDDWLAERQQQRPQTPR